MHDSDCSIVLDPTMALHCSLPHVLPSLAQVSWSFLGETVDLVDSMEVLQHGYAFQSTAAGNATRVWEFCKNR